MLQWREPTGWQTVVGIQIFSPNGLLVTNDGKQLYINSWASGKVVHLDNHLDDKSVRRELKLDFLPDNLRWGGADKILATGLRGTPPQVGTCVMAEGTCEHNVLTAVAEISVEEFTVDCVRHLPLHMGTSAIEVADQLWVGPARGEELWVLDQSKAGSMSCQ